MYEDDPDAPPSEEEKRAAAALRKALEPGEAGEAPKSAEGKWLAAHLRLPTAEDALGDVRAWRLSRGARESLQSRRGAAQKAPSSFSRLSRSLTSTGGLLAAAAMLLVVSWLIVGQGQRGTSSLSRGVADGGRGARLLRNSVASARAAQSLVFYRSIKREESPSQRLDLMIQTRLAELRNPHSSEIDRPPLRSISASALSLVGALP